jgi:hypothetical protein
MGPLSLSRAPVRRLSVGVAAAAAAAALLVVPATRVHAAPLASYEPTNFSLSPTSGPAGGPITVHGTCHANASVVYQLGGAGGGPSSLVGTGSTAAAADGSWTVVDATGPAEPGQQFTFGAYCVDGPADQVTNPTFATLTYTVASTSPASAPAPAPSPTTTTVAPVSASPAFTG